MGPLFIYLQHTLRAKAVIPAFKIFYLSHQPSLHLRLDLIFFILCEDFLMSSDLHHMRQTTFFRTLVSLQLPLVRATPDVLG